MKVGLAFVGLCGFVGVLSVCMFVSGCCFDPSHRGGKDQSAEVARLQQELNNQKYELQALARRCGVSESNINSLSATGLISEIKIKLSNSSGYYGRFLSDKDLANLKDLLADEPQLEKIIRDYDSYLKQSKGKRVLILP